MKYHIAKGVFDILPQDPDPQGKWRESSLWQYVETIIRQAASEFGFREIRTPLFETTDLFTRSIGSSSDIVTKEMYTFLDKGGRSITLRPEGTAPVIRAFIEKNLDQQNQIHKLFYLAPMFRYERQQAGRFRQHHQFGVEAIGSNSPFQDVEVIHLLWTVYQRLGLKGLTLHLNSIGCQEARKSFRHALKEYLHPYFHELSLDSQTRYHTNPLRILDSKNSDDQKLLENAPNILSFLSEESKAHFETLTLALSSIGIPFNINPKLVRGLDYYSQTVFEVTSEEIGSQNSIGGGGRYDGLMKELGGADLPCFGFGAGIERIIQTMLAQNIPFPSRKATLFFLIPLGEEAKIAGFQLISLLREKNIAAEMDLTGKKLKNALRYADSIGAHFTAVVGDEELNSKSLELKEMSTGALEKISFDFLVTRLKYELQKNT